MKKRFVRVALILAVVSGLTLSSCIGKFALTNKLLSWNRTVGSKFINELVFFAFWILPVYEVSSLADLLVINSIEFWSGTNPIASTTKTVKGDLDTYKVYCDATGYTITSQSDGSVVRLDFDADERSWSVTAGGETYPLMTFIDDTHVALPAYGNTQTVISLDENGLMAYEQMASQAACL